jgi:hypothetical protein
MREMDAMETERITRALFEQLPEYSMSDPSGVFYGKVWRRDRNVFIENSPGPDWVICEYVRTDDPERARIETRRPLIVG